MKVEKRKDPIVTEGYRKDQDEEVFLENLNNILATFEEESYQDLPELHPTLHIIGAPRSGTTLLSQLIAAHLDIGYINNLIAAFWKAPICGIKLSKKLLGRNVSSSYVSDFGRTYGIYEPHEFGYFWFPLLGYKEMLQGSVGDDDINWEKVRRILINMTHAYKKPIAFKTFLLGWHIEKMQSVLPKTCFIRIRRDPFNNAVSLFYLRKKLLGSVEKWASMKPSEYHWLKERTPAEQVVGQVYFIEKAMDQQINNLNGRNIMEITYEELSNNPKEILHGIVELLQQTGTQVNFLSDPPKFFDIINEPCSDDLSRQISHFVHQYYNSV